MNLNKGWQADVTGVWRPLLTTSHRDDAVTTVSAATRQISSEFFIFQRAGHCLGAQGAWGNQFIKSQIPLRYLNRTSFELASNQLRTGSQPDRSQLRTMLS